jgi:hypothetical protein
MSEYIHVRKRTSFFLLLLFLFLVIFFLLLQSLIFLYTRHRKSREDREREREREREYFGEQRFSSSVLRMCSHYHYCISFFFLHTRFSSLSFISFLRTLSYALVLLSPSVFVLLSLSPSISLSRSSLRSPFRLAHTRAHVS